MKQKIIITLFISILSLGVFGQDLNSQYSPEERAEFQTGWMKENLALSEEQTMAVDSLNLVYAKKMESLKSVQGRLNQIKQARSLSESKEEELQKILNNEQFKIYQDKKSELRAKMKEMSENKR